MKKIILWILGITSLIVLIGGVGFYYYIQSLLQAKEEKISYRNDKIIDAIDKQLVGIDIELVKSKASFIEQKSIEEIKDNLSSGNISYQELMAYYLINIKEKDQNKDGNNSISEINEGAMEEAKVFDENRDDRPLAGIPVLLKENINTNNMPTSAGSYALKDFIPNKNAPVVDKLIENGAIILGKTNLSEMSYYMSQKNPSGYSSKKGQTTNPFNPLVLSPLGSSSGSAVAMATDMAVSSLGTETAGSIVAPASINSVVGYKPSRGNVSGEGVIPITYSLDTVGPITKTVEDALLTYNAITDKKIEIELNKDALKGKKVGVVKSDDAFDKALTEKLREFGAEVDIVEVDISKIDLEFILSNDFKKDLNHYLETYNAPIKSLDELVAFNKEDKEVRMKYGQTYLENSLNPKRDDKRVEDIINLSKDILNKTIDDNKFDVLVFKDNNIASLAAGAGAPEVSIPFGLINNAPVGATFFGKAGDDANVLKLAYSFEQLTKLRQIPK